MSTTQPVYPEAERLAQLLAGRRRILIVQADNPDADSLGSALGLEQILGDLGLEPLLYCGMEMPAYLRYLDGWDRVSQELPPQFDVSIVVDASTETLLEKLAASGGRARLAAQPCIVLDHHAEVSNTIGYASLLINDAVRSSTGELIYVLARQLGWPLSVTALNNLMTAILGDTQGLSNQLTSALTYRTMAEMVEAGVARGQLEDKRREANKLAPIIFKYKATLIMRTELSHDGAIASVDIPQAEISEYSPLYNPGPLVQPDTLQTRGVKVSIVFKRYDDGKLTAAIRCNHGYGIAAQLAERFGGGGHAYASGFKLNPSAHARPFNEVKSECLAYAATLLDNLTQDTIHEATTPIYSV